MIIAQFSKLTSAKPKAIWSCYADLSLWAIWDRDLEYASLDGEQLCAGATGVLKPKEGPKVKFTLREVIKNQSFTSVSPMPLAKMAFYHELVPHEKDQIKITHRVEITGILAPLYAFLIGRKIKAGLPSALDNLVDLAELSTTTPWTTQNNQAIRRVEQ